MLYHDISQACAEALAGPGFDGSGVQIAQDIKGGNLEAGTPVHVLRCTDLRELLSSGMLRVPCALYRYN